MKHLLAPFRFIGSFLMLLAANWAFDSLPDDMEGRE